MPLLRRLRLLEGTVDRSTYVLGGLIAFALKYAIDWSVASLFFHRSWTPLSYWRVFDLSDTAGDIGSNAVWMFLTLLVLSLPFLWFGMTMTLLRLRDAGRSAGWAALFFVPILNVILFFVLTLVPSGAPRKGRDLSGVLESALFAVIATVAVATAAIALATRAFEMYGIGLFVAVPFCVGYLSAFLHGRRHPDKPVQSYLVALLSMVVLGGFLLALAWEGLACLIMAAPIAIVVSLLGAYCGKLSAGTRQTPRGPAPAYMAVVVLPFVLMTETALHPPAPLYRVDSEIVIDAPPATVWKNVVTFTDIAGEPEWYFRAGIAYPLRARISGRGVGAIRTCEFNTGRFIEPIDVWDAPHLLGFRVTANPPPMRELSPYGAIDAPHLHGFLLSQRGQFLLEPVAGGKTRIVGSTWYQHHLSGPRPIGASGRTRSFTASTCASCGTSRRSVKTRRSKRRDKTIFPAVSILPHEANRYRRCRSEGDALVVDDCWRRRHANGAHAKGRRREGWLRVSIRFSSRLRVSDASSYFPLTHTLRVFASGHLICWQSWRQYQRLKGRAALNQHSPLNVEHSTFTFFHSAAPKRSIRNRACAGRSAGRRRGRWSALQRAVRTRLVGRRR